MRWAGAAGPLIIIGCHTSRLELLGTEADQLLNLLRLDRLASPRIVPPWFLRLLICELVEGALLGFELAVPAF